MNKVHVAAVTRRMTFGILSALLVAVIGTGCNKSDGDESDGDVNVVGFWSGTHADGASATLTLRSDGTATGTYNADPKSGTYTVSGNVVSGQIEDCTFYATVSGNTMTGTWTVGGQGLAFTVTKQESAGKGEITLSQYNAISLGMSLNGVSGVLGGAPSLVQYYQGNADKLCSWGPRGPTSVDVWFQNDTATDPALVPWKYGTVRGAPGQLVILVNDQVSSYRND